MSKCWKCNKEFYSENLIRTLCDECLEKIPKTTATTDFVNLLNFEIKDLVDDFSKRKIADLEAKLKEKDKEIEDIRNTHIYRFYLNEDKVQDVYMTDVMLKVFNQDKISFAIEQLEKAKEKILSYEEIYYQFLESGTKVPVVCLENFRVKQVIDNQINQLKEKDNG